MPDCHLPLPEKKGEKVRIIHHEKMDIYKKSILFLSQSELIIQKLPRGRREFKDQLQRASLSIVLSFSEGHGKYGKKDKQRFYLISKGSAHECAAILDCMSILKLIDHEDLRKGKDLLYEIICILVKLCQLLRAGASDSRASRSLRVV